MRTYTTAFVQNIIITMLLVAAQVAETNGQDLTLPAYRIDIEPDDLQRLIGNPDLPDFYSAAVSYEGQDYDARVKFRGRTALRRPKHSWRIEFTADRPADFPAINLDAEFYDRSMARDYLSMRLGRLIGLPTPNCRFISLNVNDTYYGVYLEMEPVDDRFLRQRDFGEGEIFASINHMGRGAPFLNDNHFRTTYELQEGTQDAYDRLGRFLTFMHNASADELAGEFEGWLDAENVLEYFALQYMIGNWDGFGKNYHLFKADDGRYKFVPWDNDASFGNDWAGNWANDYSRLYFDLLSQQAIFRRTMELEGSRDRFVELVRTGSETYFPQLDSIVQVVYEEIRNDAYQDTMKRANNDEFDEAFANLRGYISDRARSLADVGSYFDIPDEPQVVLSSHYLPDADQSITVSIITTDSPSYAFFQIIDSIGQFAEFQANDQGENGDPTANDGVFTRIFETEGLPQPINYAAWLFNNEIEGYPFERCGLYNVINIPLQTPKIWINPDPPETGDVELALVDEVLESSSFLIGLQNVGGRTVDLSGCILSLNSGYRRTMLPELAELADGDTLWVTNHISLMQSAFPERRITGAMYYEPAAGDTISLFRADREIISADIFHESRRQDDPSSLVVINEINYNSDNRFDTDDWVEITANNHEQDLSGWKLADARSDHLYIIPEGTRISAGQFIVIARDPQKLRSMFENPGQVVGGFEFAFNNNSDDVRLLDATDALVDWVRYEDGNLWPVEADGDGSTLELTNPALSNFSWQNWEASRDPALHGTPGRQNQAYYEEVSEKATTLPTRFDILGAYPNPFNGITRIDIRAGSVTTVSLTITDLLGREISHLSGIPAPDGTLALHWIPSTVTSAGVYFVRSDRFKKKRPITLILLK